MLTSKTIAKLRKLKAAILINPEFYNQNEFIDEYPEIPTSCGTTCCMAGWADYLFNGAKAHNDRAEGYLAGLFVNVPWLSIGSASLGLTAGNTANLFASSILWPFAFSESYKKAKTPIQRAKVAAARIEYFIKNEY